MVICKPCVVVLRYHVMVIKWWLLLVRVVLYKHATAVCVDGIMLVFGDDIMHEDDGL